MATSVEPLGVDLRTRTMQLATKEKARNKKCDVRFSLIKKKQVFQKNYVSTGVRKFLTTELVLSRAWRGRAVGMAPCREADVEREEADGQQQQARSLCRSHSSLK